jgi:hypothetical protein
MYVALLLQEERLFLGFEPVTSMSPDNNLNIAQRLTLSIDCLITPPFFHRTMINLFYERFLSLELEEGSASGGRGSEKWHSQSFRRAF